MRAALCVALGALAVGVSAAVPSVPEAGERPAGLEEETPEETEQCGATVEDWTGLLQLSQDRASRSTGNVLAVADTHAHQQQPGTVAAEALGWPTPVNFTGGDHWCKGEVPPDTWTATTACVPGDTPQQVRVMTYNLFWWNLFLLRQGNFRSAGKLMEAAHAEQPLDFLGLQEADDVMRALRDANFDKTHKVIRGPYHIAIAYLASQWELLSEGKIDVAEDENIIGQYLGKRAAIWGRFKSRTTGKVVFFINHHGPLRVGKGGRCGGAAVAYNILKLIGKNARKGDFVVLVGDFNAGKRTPTIQTLEKYMVNHFSGGSHGGVDHILSNCKESVVSTKNHGTGGSDHEAISVSFKI